MAESLTDQRLLFRWFGSEQCLWLPHINNINRIERHKSRFFFTISSRRRELSPTRTLKWLGRNRVQITCNTRSAFHVQHVLCHLVLRDSSAISLTEFTSHLFEPHFIGWTINRRKIAVSVVWVRTQSPATTWLLFQWFGSEQNTRLLHDCCFSGLGQSKIPGYYMIAVSVVWVRANYPVTTWLLFQWYPFIMADGQRNGVSTYRGFSIDLLNIVATACNFRSVRRHYVCTL